MLLVVMVEEAAATSVGRVEAVVAVMANRPESAATSCRVEEVDEMVLR